MLRKDDIANELRFMGLDKGDIVLLHSSMISLGKVDGGPAAVIDAFLDVLGEEGTLVVPVFGALGILTEEVKKRPNAVISPCPLGTVAAIGKDAEMLCKDHWKADSVHGLDTPYLRIVDKDGYICLLGVDQDRNTTLHSVEAMLHLAYMNPVTRTFTTPEGEEVTKTWECYPGPHRDFIGLDQALDEAMFRSRIGNATVRLIRAREMFDIALEIGHYDPAFVLCSNPACADCVRQRAAIFTCRIDSEEAFILSASSRLAGRYVPEMIENLKSCGLRYIELDYIQGKAWHTWGAEKLSAWLKEFENEKIEVTGARLFSVPDDAQKIIDLAVQQGIKKLILPLNDSTQFACAAADAGLEVAWFNSNQGGRRAAEKLSILRGKVSEDYGFVFNPANFVLAGEMPFLQSYKLGRFIKTVNQLDLVDQTWVGENTALAQGNGEVKELISILRCHNFSGVMTLGGGAVYPGTLKDATDNFTDLLDNM